MFYVYDSEDKTRKTARDYTIEFFKESLGFKNEDIIEIKRTEFYCDVKNLGNKEENFIWEKSPET